MAELIAVLPYQLGYTPSRSLVLVMLRRRPGDGGPPAGDMGLTARIDLPPPEHEQAVADHLVGVLHRQRPHLVQLIAYEDEGDDATALMQAIQEHCRALSILVDTQARVCGGRWRRVVEPDGDRPRWRPVPEAADVPAVADLVLQGASPGGGREELAQRLDSGSELTHQAVRLAVREALTSGVGRTSGASSDQGSDAAEVWGQVLRSGQGARTVADLSAGELAELVLSLQDVAVRDALMAWLTPGQYSVSAHPPAVMSRLVRALPMSRVRAPLMVDRLLELAARIPPELCTPVLTVLAILAWWHGNGTLANIAIERALRLDPDYRLAVLIDQVLAQLVPPPPLPWRKAS